MGRHAYRYHRVLRACSQHSVLEGGRKGLGPPLPRAGFRGQASARRNLSLSQTRRRGRRATEMRKILFTYLPATLLLALLAMILVSCGGGGDGSNSGTTPAPAPPSTKSVVITGTVPGTVAIAYELATGKEAARNVASGTPKTFSLSLVPGEYYLMFIENEGTPPQGSFAFQNVTGGNVFALKANTTLDLGVLVFNNYPRTAYASGRSHIRE